MRSITNSAKLQGGVSSINAKSIPTNVLRVGRKQCGIGVTRKRPYTDVDGLITNEPNVVLATFYADCVPLYFVDPVHRAIGLSHSGWRGTVNRMGKETLIAMNREFGTEAHDVIAAIGPSICQDCYEISQDVAEHFVDEFATIDDPHASDILFYKGDGKYQAIAAASILAKTFRDEYMDKLAEEYPYYDWQKNKGYPTKAHREGIRQHGTSPYHRMSYNLLGDGQLELKFSED